MRKFLVFPSWLDVALVVLLGFLFRNNENVVLIVFVVALLRYFLSLLGARHVFLLSRNGLKYQFVLIFASSVCFILSKDGEFAKVVCIYLLVTSLGEICASLYFRRVVK